MRYALSTLKTVNAHHALPVGWLEIQVARRPARLHTGSKGDKLGAPAEKIEDSFMCDIERLISGSVVAGPADHADLLIACARIIHRDAEEISDIAGITRRALLDFRTLIARELLDAEGL